MYSLYIVEDEPVVRSALKNIASWEKMGITIVGDAADGSEALAEIRRIKPDMLMTDIRMPVLGGLELLESIKDMEIMSVVLSGYDDFTYAKKAIEQNIYAYLLKPLKIDELENVFQRLLIKLAEQKKQKHLFENSGYLLEYFFSMAMCPEYTGTYTKMIYEMDDRYRSDYTWVAAFVVNNADRVILEETLMFWKEKGCAVFTSDNVCYAVIMSKLPFYQEVSSLSAEFKKKYEKFANLNISSGGDVRGLESFVKQADEARTGLLRRTIGNSRGSGLESERLNAAEQVEVFFKLMAETIGELSPFAFSESISHIDAVRTLDHRQLGFFCAEIYVLFLNRLKNENITIEAQTAEEVHELLGNCSSNTSVLKTVNDCMVETALLARQYLSENNPVTARIKQYIKKNYAKKPSLTDLAEQFHYNQNYMSTFFKEKTGENISDYWQGVRLKKAESLLRSTSHQISEISELVGYSDYRHFCTVFKKKHGVSPMQYRMNTIGEKL